MHCEEVCWHTFEQTPQTAQMGQCRARNQLFLHDIHENIMNWEEPSWSINPAVRTNVIKYISYVHATI